MINAATAPKRYATPVLPNETHVIPDEDQPPAAAEQPPAVSPRDDSWGSPEEQASWLLPGTQHYMNATPNSNRHKGMMTHLRDSYVQIRGYQEYETDKLKQELVTYIGSLKEGEQITEMISPPEPIKALPSLPSPGHWFQCTLAQREVPQGRAPDKDDKYVTAYHATGITHALHITYEGQVNAGLGHKVEDTKE